MAETINGTKAVVWGLGISATGTGVGAFVGQSANFRAEADNVTIRDGRGQTQTSIYYDQRQTLRLEVIPSDTTIALSKTASIVPKPGAIVTVVDADETQIDGTNGGKYICESAEKSKSNTDAVKITMELKQWVDADIAAVISS